MAKMKTEKPGLMAGSVAAGFPSPAEQYVETPLDLNELLVRKPAATFFVRAAGDSMVGAGICSRDILVVDRSQEATNVKHETFSPNALSSCGNHQSIIASQSIFSRFFCYAISW